MTSKVPFQSVSLSITSPFGEDLQIQSIEGSEAISELFEFHLKLISEKHDLDFSSVVGKNIAAGLTLADGSTRYINGMVMRFEHGGLALDGVIYRAQIRPWLWQLTLYSDCRIYQNQAAPDIITGLFDELGFTDYKNQLEGTYNPREYCVQYMETGFDFVSRLMEDEGIFYFFEHTETTHTLVLADSQSAHVPCPGQSEASFQVNYNESSRYGIIPSCNYREGLTSGETAIDDYNFEKPADDLLATATGTGSAMKRFEYPGGFQVLSDGQSKAKRFQESHEVVGAELSGLSFAPAFCCGYQFTLKDHPRSAVNQAYVLRRVKHSAWKDGYSNAFTAFPVATPFRPPRVTPWARIFGAQTALVVGKSGEEIWTEQYGRIKVQFHWDRIGVKDENSSCWIRVAQGWAGKQWGAWTLPRLGQEVVVSFLDGDPDRPLVTGCVYNADQTLPYALPAEQTKTTLKSNSSKGGGGFNEIRFEDKKDSEEIFIQAQKDMNLLILNDRTTDIGNNETTTVKQDRTVTISEGNESLTVSKGNRTVAVSTGTETYSVKGTRDLTVEGNETHTDKADFTHNVTGNFTLKVDGDISIEAGGNITIKAGGDLTCEASGNLTDKAGSDLTNQAGSNLTNKAGANMNNEAGAALTNKGSASQTVDGGPSLTVKGGIVQIN